MRGANEDELAIQRRVFREYRIGSDPDDVALRATAEVAPRRVLEVGQGDGAFALRLARKVGADVVAVDVSPEMVGLARSRGVDARLGNVENLPFEGESFDCVVANWMLYLASDVDRAIGEIARVLRVGGRLVAGAVAQATFSEVRDLLGGLEPAQYSFNAETGADALSPHFSRVERRDVEGTIRFPDWCALRDFIAVGMPERAHLAERVPRFQGAFSTRDVLAVFVADR